MLERTLLGLFLDDCDRRLALHDGDRGLSPDNREGLRFCGLLEGEAFQCFFHLEPTLFDVLRFLQFSVFRHSSLTPAMPAPAPLEDGLAKKRQKEGLSHCSDHPSD